jgi:4-amino-4-deoxy-L-arabinose transferase-like glycosyltransferase
MSRLFKFLKSHWQIIAIIGVGILLRFYMLGLVPSSLNRDEAALGYNAYSLLQTGKDEFGESWPLTFKSFGDYKMPGYIYLLIPFIKIFGLNNFSVRLISALAGVLMILIIYWFSLELFKDRKVALFSSLGLAISPWAVFYSRIGFETNVAIFFIATSFLLLFKGLKKPWLWLASALLMVLSLFTYNHSFIVVPIMTLVFFGLFFKKIWVKKKLMPAIFAGVILVTGVVGAYKTVGRVNQAKGMIAVYNNPILHQEWANIRADHELEAKDNKFLYLKHKFSDTRYVYFGKMIVSNSLKNFTPWFLAVRDGKFTWNGIKGIGFFYPVDLLFIFIGLIVLLSKIKNKRNVFLLSLLFVGTLPASLSIDQAHPNRSLNMFWGLYLVFGLGLNFVVKKMSKMIRISKVINVFIILGYLFCAGFLIERYFIYQPKHYAVEWFDQIDEVVSTLDELKPESIILSSDLPEIYIYYLFYSHYPPQLFQDSVIRTRDSNGFYTVHQFGKVKIKVLQDFDNFKIGKKTVILGTDQNSDLLSRGDGGGEIKSFGRNYVYKIFSFD